MVAGVGRERASGRLSCEDDAGDQLRTVRRHHPPARRGAADQDRAVGSSDGPARQRGPQARHLVPGLPQSPVAGDRPRPAAHGGHRARADRGQRVVRDPPRRVRAGHDGRVGRAAGRHRGAHRGQVEPRAAGPDRARHRGLRRPGLSRDAHARDHQPRARADRALAREADRPAFVHGAGSGRQRPYGHPDLGSHYHGQVEATESRYEGGPADPSNVKPETA